MTDKQTPKINGNGHTLERPVYDPTAASAIEVEHIVKKYGDFTAVDDVSFSVKEGEIFGLLGPNGAGKSTLIRMMTTLIPITSGKARIGGHDVAKEPNAARRMIGVIPQALTSDLDLTVAENMNIYAKLYDVCPSLDQLMHEGNHHGKVRIAGGDERNQRFPFPLSKLVEYSSNAGHKCEYFQKAMPDACATVAISLSPRPERFTRMSLSLASVGASCAAYARAWLDSRAGIMPS